MKRTIIYSAALILACGIISLKAEQRHKQPVQKDDLNFNSLIQPVPLTAKFSQPDYYVWGGSMVKDNKGVYHLFYSRWKRAYGFEAWAVKSEIAHATAPTPFGPFTFRNVALPRRGKEMWDGLCTHNPTIHKFGSTYYLYYMGNTGDDNNTKYLNYVHRNNQRIGVAVTKDLNGKWKRFNRPLIDVSSDSTAADALVVTNPSITMRPDGSFLMVYKAVGKHKPLPFGGPVVHLTATSKSPTGPFVKQMKPIFTVENVNFPAEDPYVWCQDGKYYAIVKDNEGYFTKRGRSLALFESNDGFTWNTSKYTLVTDLSILWESGQREKIKALERPQIYFEKGKPAVLLVAAHQDENGEIKSSYNIQIPLKKR